MNIRNPRFWLGALSSTGVLYLVFADAERVAPGELALVHGREDELTKRGACDECHGSRRVTMATACLECHEDIELHIDDGVGLHGTLEDVEVQKCAICHSEHHGPNFALVNARAFGLAGFDDVEQFHLQYEGFRMEGPHLDLDCIECHTNAQVAQLDHGDKRYIGLEQDCSTCHDDYHEGQLSRDCADCHGQTAFEDVTAFVHEDFPTVVGHSALSCRDCHAQGAPHALELVAGHGARPSVRACQDCHESPHRNAFVEGIALMVSTTPEGSCVTCHEADHDSFRSEDLEITDDEHEASGFALDAPHDELGCEDCHPPEREAFLARYPGRPQDECRHCHEDPHGGQFGEGPFSFIGCIGCHDRHQFEPHAFTAEKHELAALVLDGSHLEIECEDCHELPGDDLPRTFRGTASTCESCHEDVHRGFFASASAKLAVEEEGECARCHETTEFSDVPEDGFDHGFWTDFPLLGAHAQAQCESCHPTQAEPDDLGRTFGWADDHFGRIEGCATCHENPHGREFDERDHPREIEGRKGCARCHVETSFRTFPDGFEHGLWTGFELKFAHEEAGCSTCHTPLAKPDKHGRTWGRAVGTDCQDCHVSPHQGQFDVKGTFDVHGNFNIDNVTDCRRCHATAVSFADISTFNHNLDSRFALDGTHRSLACSSCHKQEVSEDGAKFIRYKPLGMDCVDCHGVTRQGLRGKEKK